MLRKMFGPNMEGKQETGEKCLVRSFIICTADQGRHVWGREEISKGCWWETLKEREHLEDMSGEGRI
jgi:hypothetical protein